MKGKFFFSIFVLLVFFAVSCSEDSTGPQEANLVEEVIQSVNIDSLLSYVRILSGNTTINIDGVTQTIESRHSNFPGNDIAADYIQQKLEGYGLTVTNFNYSTIGRNVLASIEGSVNPQNIYIICAHYDDMPEEAVAPGADDNASGVAAVIEAARILRNYNFENTVIFALWDEEEQGMIGSRNWAQYARNLDMNIRGVINLDMISWETDNDPVLKVQENADGSADYICSVLLEVNSDYNLTLEPDTVHFHGGSDHKSFGEQNYPAIMLIEDYANDWNAYYHTPLDNVNTLDNNYFEQCTKLAIGTLARLIRITAN